MLLSRSYDLSSHAQVPVLLHRHGGLASRCYSVSVAVRDCIGVGTGKGDGPACPVHHARALGDSYPDVDVHIGNTADADAGDADPDPPLGVHFRTERLFICYRTGLRTWSTSKLARGLSIAMGSKRKESQLRSRCARRVCWMWPCFHCGLVGRYWVGAASVLCDAYGFSTKCRGAAPISAYATDAAKAGLPRCAWSIAL